MHQENTEDKATTVKIFSLNRLSKLLPMAGIQRKNSQLL